MNKLTKLKTKKMPRNVRFILILFQLIIVLAAISAIAKGAVMIYPLVTFFLAWVNLALLLLVEDE